MNFEIATDEWLQKLIRIIRYQSGGVFLEVGLGGGDWSFVWASRLGLKCVAVEPAPSQTLRAACDKYGVEMVEAAVCDREGTVQLYEGEMNGAKVGDTNSIRPDWWGVGGRSRTVPAVTLCALATSWSGAPFLCVKVDVEGAESAVLSSLKAFSPDQFPKLVAFEYGGGGSLKSGRGGWADEFISSTMNCLNLLKDLGYCGGMILDKSSWSPRFFRMAGVGDSAGTVFDDADEVGNIIVWKSGVDGHLKQGCFFQHHLVQIRCALSQAIKHGRFWMDHWRIRGVNWLRKTCGFSSGAS